MKRIFSIGNKVIALSLVLLTTIAIFIPSVPILQFGQDYLVHFLLFLVVSGIIGLVINNRTVLFTSFGCAGLLAIYLKNASNVELKNPIVNSQVKMNIVHINLSAVSDAQTVFTLIADPVIDVISFQEYTPDWANIITQIMPKEFKNNYEDIRIDLFGKAIFSKYPIIHAQTLESGKIPFAKLSIQKEQNLFTVFSMYMIPALDNASKIAAKEQLDFLGQEVKKSLGYKIVLGEFNQVYWSHDIISFRAKTDLLNSRRNIDPSSLKVPYDHIFYSSTLQCYAFREIVDGIQNHIGCLGSFQVKERPTKIIF